MPSATYSDRLVRAKVFAQTVYAAASKKARNEAHRLQQNNRGSAHIGLLYDHTYGGIGEVGAIRRKVFPLLGRCRPYPTDKQVGQDYFLP